MNKTLLALMITSCLVSSQVSFAQTQYSVSDIQDAKGHIINDWISNNQSFSIKLENQSQKLSNAHFTEQANFQIFIGDNDVSSLFSLKNNSLIFKGGIPLPAGENEIVVNQLINNEWKTIGNSSLQIMTSSGLKEAIWEPRLEINVSSQLDENVSGDSIASEKPRFSDIASNFGLNTRHSNDDFTIESSWNLLSVSNRQQAIQYGQKFEKARKTDLSDYQVSVTTGKHIITLGNTSYGNNELLISGLSRRGISWQYQNDNELVFNGALLNGTDIVGFNNITGLENHSKQYVNALGFGMTALKDSRISFRIEGTYMDAIHLSENNFGISEIISAEKNNGLGFKLTAMDKDATFNGELSIALSRYTNPEDEFLSFGDELLILETESSLAHSLNLSYVLLENWETPWSNNASVLLSVSHAKADPLYQTLTSFVEANVESQYVGMQYQIGNISGNFGVQSSQDNLDKLINLLTTKTENSSFSANIPLAQVFSKEQQTENDEPKLSPWLPSVDYSYQDTHQFATTTPDANISGFNSDSHLPDQLTKSHNLSASWQVGIDTLNLQATFSDQDNRQTGRENSDFLSLQHGIGYNFQQNEQTNWSFYLARNRQYDKEASKVQYNNSATISYNWQSLEGLSLSVNYGLSEDNDSLDESETTSTNADIGLVKNLVNGEWWIPADGSISMRINYNDSKSIDRIFDQFNQFGTITAQLGINLSFQ